MPAFLNAPLLLVTGMSVVIGLAMVYVFQLTSDQHAIKLAKNRLKAHLLAVQLYQDQLPVVISSYGRILLGTLRYLRLASLPLLIAIVPITLFIAEADRFFGLKAIEPSQTFLLTATVADPDLLGRLDLQLPAGIVSSAPAVHISAEKQVVWRLMAQQAGNFEIRVIANGRSFGKRLAVSPHLVRLSSQRSTGQFWRRFLHSTEGGLPSDAPIQSIAIDYPSRSIDVFGISLNWILLFFILSMIAGFIFKNILGIEV